MNPRLLLLAVLLYTYQAGFYRLASAWYPDSINEKWPERTKKLRKRFWRSVVVVAVTVIGTIAALRFSGILQKLEPPYLIRAVAATLMLAATLGRGGWLIQSWGGNSVVERIDRGMYVLAQLGGVSLLLAALAL